MNRRELTLVGLRTKYERTKKAGTTGRQQHPSAFRTENTHPWEGVEHALEFSCSVATTGRALSVRGLSVLACLPAVL